MKRLLTILALAFVCTSALSGELDGWTISTKDSQSRYHGVPMANGVMGIMPGRAPFAVRSVILNNVYDAGKNQGVSRIADAPNPFRLEVTVGGETVGEKNVTGWSQTLDMRHACLRAGFTLPGKASFSYELRALRNMPHVGVVSVRITAKKDIELGLKPVTSVPKGFAGHDSTMVRRDIKGPEFLISRHWGGSPYRRILMSASSVLVADGKPVPEKVSISKGDTFTFHMIGSVCTAQDFSDPVNESDREVIYAVMEGPQKLIERHESMWDDLWQGDVIIDGDPYAQTVVRSALYQIYSCGREGTASSIPPFGLSCREYNGHIFWDSELWMYPPMLFLSGGIARSMVDYRTSRLAPAVARAQAYGYKGAMFPWESDWSGEEACPTSALTGTFEHHISADVAIAVWNYYCMSGDRGWLRADGWPLLKAVADFWISRVEQNSDGTYSVRNVVCADEFAEGVDDNAFTNGAAVCALRAAVRAAEICGQEADARWALVADGLRILSAADGTSLEYDGYDGRIIKQADANLLAYPLQIVTDSESIRRDLLYYEPKILPKGPMMSYAILALQWARLGEGEKAYELFEKALDGHVRPPFFAFSETAGEGDTFFVTGCGGVLQAVINGFCGLELTEDGVVQLDSALPRRWKSVTVTGVGPERRTFVRK